MSWSMVLTLARLDSGLPGVSSQSFDLLALLDEVIGDAQFEAESLRKLRALSWWRRSPYAGHADLLMRAVEKTFCATPIRYTRKADLWKWKAKCQGGQVPSGVSDRSRRGG